MFKNIYQVWWAVPLETLNFLAILNVSVELYKKITYYYLKFIHLQNAPEV